MRSVVGTDFEEYVSDEAVHHLYDFFEEFTEMSVQFCDCVRQSIGRIDMFVRSIL